jgi:hypothetical protein
VSAATVWVDCPALHDGPGPWAAGPPAFAADRVREARQMGQRPLARWADEWPGWCRAFGQAGPWPLVPARTLPLP